MTHWRLLASRFLLALLLAVAAAAPLALTGPAPAVAATGTSYRVVAGDTVLSVSRATGVPWRTLVKDNRIGSSRTLTVGRVLRLPAGVRVPTAPTGPSFTAAVPSTTSQIVRTVRSNLYCSEVFCTVTQAWSRDRSGRWAMVKQVRSTIGPNGFDKTRAADGRAPSGVYTIPAIFSTTATTPNTSMPWKRRLSTSTVTGAPGGLYNTWIEDPGTTDGDRSSMRYGFLVNYNNIRVSPGTGPAPVQGKGSGIFYHTSTIGGRPWIPTAGCTMLGDGADMQWFTQWLDRAANPRVVQNM